MTQEFTQMYDAAEHLLSEHPESEMALVLMTGDGKLHSAALHHIQEGQHREENIILSKVIGSKVTHCICMWHDGTLDVPSAALREKLRLNLSQYGDMEILLQGKDAFITKKFETLFED